MENSLVVRSDGSSNWAIIGMGLFGWALLFLYVTDGFTEMGALISPFFLVVTALWILMLVGFCLNYGRTFTLAPEGVTVSLPWLHYRRFYPWRELTVHHEEYPLALLLCLKSEIGAVIIQRKKAWFKKPKFLLPGLYAIFFRPLSTIYLHFYEDLNLSGRESAYMVQKEEFLEKMSAFGVLTPEFYKEIESLPKL